MSNNLLFQPNAMQLLPNSRALNLQLFIHFKYAMAEKGSTQESRKTAEVLYLKQVS